jgi:hypothetical protein
VSFSRSRDSDNLSVNTSGLDAAFFAPVRWRWEVAGSRIRALEQGSAWVLVAEAFSLDRELG